MVVAEPLTRAHPSSGEVHGDVPGLLFPLVSIFCLLSFLLEDLAGENIETARGSFTDNFPGVLDENDVARYARGKGSGRGVHSDERLGVGYRRAQFLIPSGQAGTATPHTRVLSATCFSAPDSVSEEF